MTYTDPYYDRDACIERLYSEYQKHKKLIVAVDYDDTVSPWKTTSTFDGTLSLLQQCRDLGFYIVVFTASKPERYESITNYMHANGIPIASINKNPIELPYGNNGKIYYNILLDDRAGLWEARCILQSVINRIKKDNQA